MLSDMWALLTGRSAFFLELLWEHIEISLAAIVIAIVFGGLAGILISEYRGAAKQRDCFAIYSFQFNENRAIDPKDHSLPNLSFGSGINRISD